MINILKFPFLFLLTIAFLSCNNTSEPRKPITSQKINIMANSIERNTQIVQSEQELLEQYIIQDTLNVYNHNNQGFWYTYNKRQLLDSIQAKTGQTISFTYQVATLTDSLIYSVQEIGHQQYIVDKQELLPILRHSLKLMKMNEKIKILTPSTLAYGFAGDNNKINKNQPLILTIELLNIE